MARVAVTTFEFMRNVTVLVPVISELAERISGGGRAGGSVDLPTPAGIAGIEASQRAAFQHRRMMGRGSTCSRNPL